MGAKLWVVRGLVALAVTVVATTGVSATSGASGGVTARLSPVCSTWSSGFGDFFNPGDAPGSWILYDSVQYNATEAPVVFAGDTLTLKVSAPAGTTARLEIRAGLKSKLVAASNIVPSSLNTTIFNDANFDNHEMIVKLVTTRPGPISMDVGCVGQCRVTDSQTVDLASPLSCLTARLGVPNPTVSSTSRFTPTAPRVTPSAPAPVVKSAGVPAAVVPAAQTPTPAASVNPVVTSDAASYDAVVSAA